MMIQNKYIFANKGIGFLFYDHELPTALREAQEYAQKQSLVVASMPEILLLKRQLPFTDSMWIDHILWKQDSYTCASEEDVGTTPQGNKVMIAVHGGGILTPERIEIAYNRGLTKQYAAHLEESEVRKLLEGKLVDGTEIPVYSFTDFKAGITDLPRRYAVVMDFNTAKNAASGCLFLEDFRDNPLVIVRAGGVAEADDFVEKVAERYTKYGNWHPFNVINADEAQGNVLCVHNDFGLDGSNYLNFSGCFVAIALEALVDRSVPRYHLRNTYYLRE